jgi:FkbM family methyltransferase
MPFPLNVDPLEILISNYRKFFGTHAPIIFDVGSRDGVDAKYIQDRLNSQLVICIDANPIAVDIIKNKYPDFKVHETAVSNENGQITFNQVVSDNLEIIGCSSIFDKDLENEPIFKDIINKITVPVVKLTDIIEQEGLQLSFIDVMKIDVEGYSYQVLEGLGESLQNIKILHIETEVKSAHDGHKNSLEVRNFMEVNNFYLADVSYEWGPGIEDQVWVNKRIAQFNTECWSVV